MLRFVWLILLVMIIGISVGSISAQETNEIPSWVKSVAGYWSEDRINDSEFIEALEFLIDNRVINLGDNVVVDNSMSEKITELQEKYDTMFSEKKLSDENYNSQIQSAIKDKEDIVEKLDEKYDAKVKSLKTQSDESEKQMQEYYKEVLDKKDLEIKKWKDQYKNAVGMKTQ